MAQIAARPPPVRTRAHVDSLARDTRTLRQHYTAALKRYAAPARKEEDELLERVFTREPGPRPRRAATLLRRLRPKLHATLVAQLGCSEYLVHQVMRAAIRRCSELRLYVRGDRRRVARHAEWLLRRLVRAFERSAGRRLTL